MVEDNNTRHARWSTRWRQAEGLTDSQVRMSWRKSGLNSMAVVGCALLPHRTLGGEEDDGRRWGWN